jgi:hypothetical protein
MMKRPNRFMCPACNRFGKDAGVELCEYDAGQLMRLNDVLTLIRQKYPALRETSGSAILIRFWAKHVEKDPDAMQKIREVAAGWRGEGLDKTDDLTPDPKGLF